MTARIISATLVCALLAGLALWLAEPASELTRQARALGGERWYALSLDGRHLGYLHTDNYRDRDGNWVFESEQRFAMNREDSVATISRRTFASAPPHALISAEQLQSRGDRLEGVRIDADGSGYLARRLPEDGAAPSRLVWQYGLADYLDFELWLATTRPQVGQARSVRTLNFDRLAPVRRTFAVVDLVADGYAIENRAPYSATRIQLDERFAPTAMTIAGLFDLHLVPKAEALAPRSTLQAASYHIPTDRRLPNHTAISELQLAILGHDAPQQLFPEAEREADQWTLTLRHNPLANGRPRAEHTEETVHLPAGHPEIRALARDVVAGISDDQARAQALNRFVHEFVTYQPGGESQSVLAVLSSRRGDCTEFADLLTSLARSLDLPARTVFGLAYEDGQEPAFAYHAWNEIFVDGQWRPFDPTWGLERLDATHIPLPDDESAALMLLTGSVSLTFKVLDVSYFAD